MIEGTSRSKVCSRRYYPGEKLVIEDELFSCSLEEAPEYYTHPRTLSYPILFNNSKPTTEPLQGVERVGVIKTTFPADFDYGTTTSGVNPQSGKTVHMFKCDFQAIFGAKGNNLLFRDVVDGNVVGKSVIEFEQT